MPNTPEKYHTHTHIYIYKINKNGLHASDAHIDIYNPMFQALQEIHTR
jgi:hypothetical protein